MILFIGPRSVGVATSLEFELVNGINARINAKISVMTFFISRPPYIKISALIWALSP